MKNNIVIVLITLVVFIGGLVVGGVIRKHRPEHFPVPPMGEFVGHHGEMVPPHSGNMEKMEDHMKAVRAEMDLFAGKMKLIHEDFRTKVHDILNGVHLLNEGVREGQNPCTWSTSVGEI